MKFLRAYMSCLEIFINFAKQPITGCRHRGELISFCPSENLENSREKAKRLKAAPPVCLYTGLPIHHWKLASIYGCELKFHSFFAGNSRTF